MAFFRQSSFKDLVQNVISSSTHCKVPLGQISKSNHRFFRYRDIKMGYILDIRINRHSKNMPRGTLLGWRDKKTDKYKNIIPKLLCLGIVKLSIHNLVAVVMPLFAVTFQFYAGILEYKMKQRMQKLILL